MHDLALKNPDQIKQELDSISEQMSEALYTFRRCEEFKKITFSQITLTKKLEKNCSVSEAEKWAYSDANYATIIEGLLVANILFNSSTIRSPVMTTDFLKTPC